MVDLIVPPSHHKPAVEALRQIRHFSFISVDTRYCQRVRRATFSLKTDRRGFESLKLVELIQIQCGR